MSWIAQYGFKDIPGKGEYIPALNIGNMVDGTIYAAICLSGFIGGCGRIGLRSWASRWEIAYFLFASVPLLSETAAVARKGYDITYCVLFYAGFVLVYLPLCFISPPPPEAPLVGTVARSKPAADDLDEP
ncbi:MAG: hypothetical protein ACP5XB_03380 [Isosphaeraceae bacterium]